MGLSSILLLLAAGLAYGRNFEQKLDQGWTIQSSAPTSKMYQAIVPSTLAGTIVTGELMPDPYFGMNLRLVPGTTYPIDKQFSRIPMPADSPFISSWWYRTKFKTRYPKKNQHVLLKFNGINYAAQIWLNKRLIADKDMVIGTFRQFEFDITPFLFHRENDLEVEIFAPQPTSLSSTWIDWNPVPGDKDMGLWGDVTVETVGPARIKNSRVYTDLHLPDLHHAQISICADVENLENKPLNILLDGKIEKIIFSKTVHLDSLDKKQVCFYPKDFPQLNFNSPRLWWPFQMGGQNLYVLNLKAKENGRLSDSLRTTFGIRKITSELTTNHSRLFKVNGQPIFIRGGGWATDMFFKSTPQRQLQELKYVRDLNLNTIRFEGTFQDDHFLELCDKLGILTMPGWACCSMWEEGKTWTTKDFEIAKHSLEDQLQRHFNHPSTLVWLYGSDLPPPTDVEQMYLDVFKKISWPNPILAAASEANTLVGETGVKMTGPYDYVPPSYWLTDTKDGGAFGFNTETSMGPAVPPVESLHEMLPQDHLWPVDDVWNFHAGISHFQQIKYFTEGLERRYGPAQNLNDFAMKSQVLAYDGHRAMFEAYAKRKYTSTTGIIQWMLNNAWPSLIWHLYDYYLRPGGSYFGAKKALEPVHIQYSYDDKSIVIVNSTYQSYAGLEAQAEIYDFDLQLRYKKNVIVDLAKDSSLGVISLPDISNLSKTYFVNLKLKDSTGSIISRNFYWLSTQAEIMDWGHGDFTRTPTLVDGDLTLLNTLPKVSLVTSFKTQPAMTQVKLENHGSHIAFFVHLRLLKKNGEEILPITWDDNYLTLMPGEMREVTARYKEYEKNIPPSLDIDGWNLLPH